MIYEYKPHGLYAAPINPNRCKASVASAGRAIIIYQCQRKPAKDGWCKQHHPDAEAARLEVGRKRYEASYKKGPYGRLEAAHKEIERLKRTLRDIAKDDRTRNPRDLRLLAANALKGAL